MAGTAAARRYARALFDLALQEKSLDPVREHLDQLDRMIQSSVPLQDLTRNPIYRMEEKRKVFEALIGRMKGPALVARFLDLLILKNRLPLLTGIVKALGVLVDEAQGRERVQVRLARGISKKDEENLRQKLQEMMRRSVELTVESDPSLIGGMVVHAGGRVYDGSLKGQIADLRRVLVKEP
ncbi:MAG TPA: ATP synthase F1 subunit delta [Nitrospiria bacterium]